MSDVPAAACWSAAVPLACRPRSRDALLAGAAAAAGTLIRANTAPLLIVPALLLWSRREHRWRRVLLVAAAMAPSTAILAVLHAHWYGSPLKSGYGAVWTIYSIRYVPTNVQRYLEWFLQTQTPLAFLWLAAPMVVRGTIDARLRVFIVAVVYPLAVFALYVAYVPWGEWGYLRFLLPAFPAMCASFGAVCVEFVSQVTPRRLALAAVIAVVTSLGVEQWRFARNEGVFRNGKDAQRFARAVDFANHVEPGAIILSDAYSGTLRFYTKRDILRWQMPAPQEIDHVLEQLHDAGHPLYFVGDPFEERDFKVRYADAEVSRWFETGRIPDVGFGFVAATLTPRR
jgi:hypothetical protein